MKSFTFKQYRRTPKEVKANHSLDTTTFNLDNMVDSSSKDSSGHSKDKDNAAYLKRREQVRRAQRTHRERKEAYIKSLETEVLQLRTNEANILQESRSLYNEIGRLKGLLEQHGIPYGEPSPSYPLIGQVSGSSGPPSVSSVSILSNPHHFGQQQIHVSGSRSSNDFYLSESDGSQVAGSQKSPRRKISLFRNKSGQSETDSNTDSNGQAPTPSDVNAISARASNLNLRDIDQTNLGMEFVLTLESPCLHHTQGEHPDPHAPTNHALTASAPLLFQSPTQPVPTNTATTTSPPAPSWETPHVGLEKLLSLSSNIPLTDELTPVQAWHQIRSHPEFQDVEVGGLRKLTQEMLKNVKCHGFGAVIDLDIFENLVGKNLWNGFEVNAGFGFGI